MKLLVWPCVRAEQKNMGCEKTRAFCAPGERERERVERENPGLSFPCITHISHNLWGFALCGSTFVAVCCAALCALVCCVEMFSTRHRPHLPRQIVVHLQEGEYHNTLFYESRVFVVVVLYPSARDVFSSRQRQNLTTDSADSLCRRGSGVLTYQPGGEQA